MNNNNALFWRRILTSLVFCLTPIFLLFSQLSENCSLAGRWAEGECFAVYANGPVAYYATGGLLKIVDYTDPLHPVELGEYACNGRIESIKLIDDYAYLVGGLKGYLKILDVSDPGNPTELGSLDLPEGNDVVVDGDIAYVACQGRGLYIVDIADRTNPKLLSSVDPPGETYRIAYKNDIIYATTEWYGFSVIDVADKRNPVIVQNYELEGTYRGIEIYENTLFLCATNDGLAMYQIEPDITYIGSYDEEGHAEDLMVIDGIAYVANRYSGVYFLDVTDPNAPSLIGELQTRRAADIFVNDTYIYVADTWAFHMIDGSDLANPVSVVDINMANDITSFVLDDDYIYTSNIYRGMHILDVENPVNPEKIGTIELAGTHLDIAVQDTLAFLAGGNSGLILMSVKNPENPWRISSLQFISSNTRIAVEDQFVFAGVVNEGMYVVDVSDPADPTEIGLFLYMDKILKMVPQGDIVYVLCEGDGIYAIDITVPSGPVEIGHLETEGDPESMVIVGNRAYLAEGNRGLSIIDISDPTNLSRMMNHDSESYLFDVAVRGHYAYLADGNAGLRVFDFGVINQIEEVAFFETGEKAIKVALGDAHIYVAGEIDGIYVFEFDSLSVSLKETFLPGTETNKLIRTIYPNPSSGLVDIQLSSQVKGKTTISIFDQKGNTIRTYSQARHPGNMRWDGIDHKGDQVVPGMYFLEVIADGKRQVQKLIIQ
jgi:hypothetical protein